MLVQEKRTVELSLHPYRVYYIYFSVLMLAVALLALLPFPVQADGGAPNLAYVAGAGRGISVIDIGQQRVVHTFPVMGNPSMVLLSSDGAILYVTQPTLGHVAELAARTGRLLCTISVPGHPTLLALSPDGTLLYTAGEASTQVTVVATATCALQHTYQVNEGVNGLAVTTVVSLNGDIRNQLWITGTTTLMILTEQVQQIEHIAIPGGPRFLCLPGGLTAYITTQQGSVVAVDTRSHQVFAQLLTGSHFGPMDYDAITGEIYVPDQQHNQLVVLSPILMGTLLTPREPERVTPLQDTPQSVAITSDGQLGFIALRSGRVSILNIPEHSMIQTLSVSGTPRFIITGLYPPLNDPLPRQAPVGAVQPPIAPIILLGMGVLALLLVLWFLVRRMKYRKRSRSAPKSAPKNARLQRLTKR